MRKQTSARQKRLKRLGAFVSAPADVDTQVLRRLLKAEGVDVDDAYSHGTRGSVEDSMLERIRLADLVVAVVTKNPWTAYEIGLCDALAKPVLILVAPDMQLPPYLGVHQHLRTELTENDLLRITVRRFVEEVRSGANRYGSRPQAAVKRSQPPHTKMRTLWASIRRARGAGNPRYVEELVHDLLRTSAGTTVAQDPVNRDRGVDFAIWDESLARIVGNPLLVEVKAGHLSSEGLKVAEVHLYAAMQNTGARLGLLLYLDREGRRFDQSRWGTPYILRFDLEEFAHALERRPFADVVVERRNRLIHGID